MVHREIGRLKQKFDVVERVNKETQQPYKIQKFILEVINTNQLDNVMFELIGRMAGSVDAYELGEELEVDFVLKASARIYKDDTRFYPLIRCVALKKCDE